jgi:RimJ/RimL family protein N-acetyltransferase
LFLLTDENNVPLAYGALARDAENLLVTECVATEHRNKGFGTVVLDQLMQIAGSEGRPLIAEILTTNAASIALHEKSGFSFVSTFESDGRQLKRYIRRHDTAVSRVFRLA